MASAVEEEVRLAPGLVAMFAVLEDQRIVAGFVEAGWTSDAGRRGTLA